jgi:hypothetical protein
MRILVLNSSNIVPNSGNSQFLYTFPTTTNFKNSLIGVASISQYFSTYNVNSQNYNNNIYSYIWFDGLTYTVNMPNGYYNINELLGFLESVMIKNKHYLLTTTGQYVYFLGFNVNQTYYADQLYAYLLDTTIATTNNWTLPIGATWTIPTVPTVPQYSLGNGNFCLLIGFTQNFIWPATQTGFTTTQTTLSTQSPQITPFNSFLVYCTLVNNPSTNPTNLIFSYTPQDVNFGAVTQYAPPVIGFNKITSGNFQNFTITIKDQNFNAVSFQDPQTTIILYIKDEGIDF